MLKRSDALPLSPALIFGLVIEKVPASLTQLALNALLRVVHNRHPDCLQRMADWSGSTICIDPIDMPFMILLRIDVVAPQLTVVPRASLFAASAAIRGTLETLISLAEGRIDGETMFFSRELVVEGDTEVIVALRNTVDGADVDMISDIGAALGPLRLFFFPLVAASGRLVEKLRTDLQTLSAGAVEPALRAIDAQADRLSALEEELKEIRCDGFRSEKTGCSR